MKIGYPCINRSIGCRGNRTFRLSSYSDELLVQTVQNNLDCLAEMLRFNLEHNLLFFRITSDLVPFASHPVCTLNWQSFFADRFLELGTFVHQHNVRISMHPDQFVLLNALDDRIVQASIRELSYHAQVMDLMGLDNSAKVQIHIGGVYGDKTESMQRFVQRLDTLEGTLRGRLVIENDDRSYSVADCLQIHAATGIPVVFDHLHHQARNDGETVEEAVRGCAATWGAADGLPMVDYSSQKPSGRRGEHALALDVDDWARFLERTQGVDFDVMLEIKDKERSALKAVDVAHRDPRFRTAAGPRAWRR